MTQVKITVYFTSSKRLERSKELDDLKSSFLAQYIYIALTDLPSDIIEINKIRINELYNWLKNQAINYNSANPHNRVPVPNLYGNLDSNIEIATIKAFQVPRYKKSSSKTKISRHINIKISRSRLPSTHSKIIGRKNELRIIDQCWKNNNINILGIVAWAGVGKTALLNHWLNKFSDANYKDAEVVYCWSFYNQGTTDRVVSSDLFIETALAYFKDPNPLKGSAWEKGERLANLIRTKTNIINP